MSLAIPLGPECRGGCAVAVIGIKARSTGPLPGVPISKLFDPNGPHTFRMSVTLNVVEVSTYDDG